VRTAVFARILSVLTSLVAVLAATLGLLLVVPGLAAAEEPPLSSCPLLLENKSTGTCVALLQHALNKTGAPYNLPEGKQPGAGTFGAATRIAVLDFQGRNGLAADGNAGPQVIRALVAQVGDVRPPDITAPPPGTGQPALKCTAHKANTATWAKCQSTDGAGWARLKSTCDLPALPENKTNVTKWELVPAGGELTISDECKFKAVDAVVEWRPY
jgi:hypothetical protein